MVKVGGPLHHVATDLTPEQARAYRLADNQTGSLSEWDLELLPSELAELDAADFDLSLLGFGEDDLAKLMQQDVSAGLTDPDDPVTQRGDLWLLGDHRLLCGDSASAADLDRLLDGQPIHLVNTDPPYNVRVEPRSKNAIAAGNSSFRGDGQRKSSNGAGNGDGTSTPKSKMRAKDRPLENDFVSDEEFDRLLDAWFGNIARVLLPGRSFYIWGGYANCGNYPPFLRKHGLYFSQAVIWDKQHPAQSPQKRETIYVV
jgi:hypothetical protein